MGDSFLCTSPTWVHSHGQQISRYCSNVDHSSLGCSPSGTAWCSVDFPQGHKSYQKTSLPRIARSLSGTCFSRGFQWFTASSQASFCSMNLLHRLKEDLCIPMKTQLLYHYVNHGMQGYLRSGTWITSCTSFPTYLGVCCMALLTYSYSAVFWSQLHMSNSIFFPS